MVSNDRKIELEEFLKSTGMSIKNIDLLDTALTHSSFVFETKNSEIEDNERMEFLGDAVLKLGASRYLYERFADYAEGGLTKIRAILVSDKTISKFAVKINLDKYLKVGYHEAKLGGRTRSSTMACAFEAVLGAFYLDGQFGEIYNFLKLFFEDEVTKIDQSASKYNFKAMLQEYAQGHGMQVPEYLVVEEQGPAHNKLFKIEVAVNQEILGYGEGKTKKEAHQQAAKMALNTLGLHNEE